MVSLEGFEKLGLWDPTLVGLLSVSPLGTGLSGGDHSINTQLLKGDAFLCQHLLNPYSLQSTCFNCLLNTKVHF